MSMEIVDSRYIWMHFRKAAVFLLRSEEVIPKRTKSALERGNSCNICKISS